MKKYSLIAFSLTVLLPLSLFFLPLWLIEMEAPQYPEGLGLYININSVTGINEHGLESVNSLNHYIGMKKIKPNEIDEFKYIPSIIIGMTILGLILLFVKKRSLLFSWLILYCVLGSIGLYDFYLWEKDYGSNLDPKAIIKASGITYQPPFIGTKSIMNFNVTSLPAIGGFVLFFALSLGFLIVIYDYKTNKKIN
ncbi:MAG: hypothetical protein NTW25_13200 [Candidatus Kapabacteria bacterium]|nr:hypothetical protein [Candidatus Kapabacteria bacterium]